MYIFVVDIIINLVKIFNKRHDCHYIQYAPIDILDIRHIRH